MILYTQLHTHPRAHLQLRAPPAPDSSTAEVVKMNQCQGIYMEGCKISGGRGNTVDYVAVQVGAGAGAPCVYVDGMMVTVVVWWTVTRLGESRFMEASVVA